MKRVSQYAKELVNFFTNHYFNEENVNLFNKFKDHEQVTFYKNKSIEGYVNIYSDKHFVLRWETEDTTYPIYGLFQGKIFFGNFMEMMTFLEEALVNKSKNCTLLPYMT